jgi:hypothetical protein
LVSTTDPLGKTTTYVMDALGRQVEVIDGVRHFLRSANFGLLQRTGPADPCRFPSGYNLYFSGSDIAATTLHIEHEILDRNLPALLHRRPVDPPYRPKNSRQNCPQITSVEFCDEYPFISTEENGDFPVSYEGVPMWEQFGYAHSQASTLGRFYGSSGCDISRQGGPFVVIPQTFIPTFYICGDGRIGS